ncbi:MAG: hypothetical protein QNJ54_13845 [Prochloraceae cyanobacterium]|nr:hypothetical protein [Prochloraceae cyanobacterium]
MSLSNPKAKISKVVKVNWADRWQVYQRLQELEIPCQCVTGEPLCVELDNTKEAIQLWSVVKQLTASRRELVVWLDDCWDMKACTEEN